MLTLSQVALAQLTGAELLALLQQERRNGPDLQVGGQAWRVYRSTHRGARQGVWINLWTTETPSSERRVPEAVHVRGTETQRIGEMRRVQ